MSQIDRTKLFDRAVDLTSKEGDYVQQWLGRLVTVHAGIAAAVGLTVSWKGFPLEPPIAFVVVLLAVVAIVLTILISGVVKRHLTWQAAYVESVKEIEGNEPLLFRNDMIPQGQGIRVRHFMCILALVLSFAWTIVIVVALCMLKSS